MTRMLRCTAQSVLTSFREMEAKLSALRLLARGGAPAGGDGAIGLASYRADHQPIQSRVSEPPERRPDAGFRDAISLINGR